jgi:CzcA family heavy metal efflux pump
MKSFLGRFAVDHTLPILFLILAACIAGGYAATHMPSAIFPQTDFPRVIILVNNGVMPADEMMATVTRGVEESMKDIQGCETIRSSTGRGTAEIDLFFSWSIDIRQAELQVNSRLSQIRSSLPSTASTEVYRMTFSTFPIIGLSVTGNSATTTGPWELARYSIKPELLRIPGVARVDLVGGHPPEYLVTVDPVRLALLKLSLSQVTDALARNNLVSPAGVHDEQNLQSLTVVDGRLHSIEDIQNLTVPTIGGKVVAVREFATVERAPEPSFQAVTADGTDAVLLNIFSQPDASTIDIAEALNAKLIDIRKALPPGLHLSTFYDQSLLVRASLRGVWEAIAFGLFLSTAIIYLFLRSWSITLVAIVVIPVSVLFTILAMKLCGMSFNLMTLGGIAAAIGLIIDDAIVVVEAIHQRIAAGAERTVAIQQAIAEILPPLVGSTLTPVVVFIPLAFLSGISGVFFRALAITMVVALLTSLLLAVTLTPSLAAWAVRHDRRPPRQPGVIFNSILFLYELLVRLALIHKWFTLGLCVLVLAAACSIYPHLKSDFLPTMDEGGFVIDYIAPPGTSLTEVDREMRLAEQVLRQTPEVESYSRRTGTALGVHLVEPNTGDFLVKLKPDRQRSSDAIITDLHQQFVRMLPNVNWEFPGILTDLIGDLTWSDEAIEIKVISNNVGVLKTQGPRINAILADVKGVIDPFDGLVYTGSSISLKVRYAEAQRYGLTADSIANEVNIAMLGQTASAVVEADRTVSIRVKADPTSIATLADLRALPLKARDGTILRLDQVVDIEQSPGQLELERDDLRQDIAVTANLQNRDLGSAMAEVKQRLAADPAISQTHIEYGGLYQQQQESFHSLTIVLATAIVLVFTVALLEFGTFHEPIAIVFGAVVSLFGITTALILTGTSLNIIAFLGAIIGMGIVHKNGLLMLDSVRHLQAEGLTLEEALVQSGRRRLRPVLMTSFAAALGMLPLAYGIGSTDILKSLALCVIGAVCTSVLLSLIATPTAYYILRSMKPLAARSAE